MSKNKRVILASVGVLLAMVLAVLMIRSPVAKKEVAPEPVKQVVTAAPKPSSPPKAMDDSHKKVANIIDSTSTAIVKEAPGLWSRLTDSWEWVMGFDAKHAVIFLGVLIFVLGMIATNKNKRNQH